MLYIITNILYSACNGNEMVGILSAYTNNGYVKIKFIFFSIIVFH